jgi:hypothetical protein
VDEEAARANGFPGIVAPPHHAPGVDHARLPVPAERGLAGPARRIG